MPKGTPAGSVADTGSGSAPAISVVIPTHNRETMLCRALASVFAQRFAPCEVIVVNDGSSDATAVQLVKFADTRLRAIHHQRPLGAAAARNAGLALARAPIVAFLDDDDEQLPGFLAETVHAHSMAPRMDLVWTGVIFHQPDGSETTLDWSRWADSPRFVNRLSGSQGYYKQERCPVQIIAATTRCQAAYRHSEKAREQNYICKKG